MANYEDDLPWGGEDENPFESAGLPANPAPAAKPAAQEPSIGRPARGAFAARGAGSESGAAAQPMLDETTPSVPPVARVSAPASAAAAVSAPKAALGAASNAGYAENYNKLRRAAQALREQQEPDLDALIPLVDDALAAYKGCKARIDQVKALLGERLEQLEDTAQKPAGNRAAR